MVDYVIETKDLTKNYAIHEAVGRVDLHVERGAIYGLIGENGAGKSSLIGMLAGTILPTSGEIILFGEDSESGLGAMRSRMGVLVEHPAYYPKLTVAQNLELVRIQRGIPGKESIGKVVALLGLADAVDIKVQEVSMGIKQRLGIAMALLGEPEILILDEPLNGIDPKGMVRLRELFGQLAREEGVTVVISSHDLKELSQIATSYGIMHEGRLVKEMSKQQLEECCKKMLRMKVDSIGKATWVMENVLETRNYDVVGEDTLRIFEYINDPGVVVQALMKEGVKISEITTLGDTLEDYYMGLVGGKRHAKSY